MVLSLFKKANVWAPTLEKDPSPEELCSFHFSISGWMCLWNHFKPYPFFFLLIISHKEPTRFLYEACTRTCLDWENSNTRWPCLCHIFSKDSTTIIFPERFQYPNWSSPSSSSGMPLRFLGPPEKRSGWLQIFLRATSPEKIYGTKELCPLRSPHGK